MFFFFNLQGFRIFPAKKRHILFLAFLLVLGCGEKSSQSTPPREKWLQLSYQADQKLVHQYLSVRDRDVSFQIESSAQTRRLDIHLVSVLPVGFRVRFTFSNQESQGHLLSQHEDLLFPFNRVTQHQVLGQLPVEGQFVEKPGFPHKSFRYL